MFIEPETYDLWLDPGMQDAATVQEFLKPHDAALMRSYPISTRTSNVADDDLECATPIQPETPAAESIIPMKKPGSGALPED